MAVFVFVTMPVPVVAISGGVTRRGQRHYQQDDRGHDVQTGDVEKGGFDSNRVVQFAGDERGRCRKNESGKGEHPQRACYYSLSYDIQGGSGQDGLVAEQKYAQQRQDDD